MELNNIADNPDFAEIKEALRSELHRWMIDTHDLGLLPEADYMIRSASSTPYDYARRETSFDAAELVNAAELVGMGSPQDMITGLSHTDSGVRYWSAIALQNASTLGMQEKRALETALEDAFPGVAIGAAEALLHHGPSSTALSTLERYIQDNRPWVALQAARSVLLVGESARPIIPTMYQVLEKNLGEPGGRIKYKDFNYAAFTSWALEWALKELGEDVRPSM